jgi:hypothetical protein
MARTARDIEAYLEKLARPYELLQDSTYVLDSGEHRPPIALRVSGPILVARVFIGPAPQGQTSMEAALFRRMLQLNASDLLYCAYGIEQDHIVLSAAMELENLDLNELDAVLADMDLALARHVAQLRELSQAQAS